MDFMGMPMPFDELPEHIQQAIREQREQHDRQHMAQDAIQSRIHNMLDRMDADDLVTLRYMLLAGDGMECNTNQMFHGQIIALLRNVHQRDQIGEPIGMEQLQEQQTGVRLDASS